MVYLVQMMLTRRSIEYNNLSDKIEVINVNNSPLIITNKTVNIPLASNDTAGVVKTSNNENKISLDEEGVMEVNDINVNKLVQTSGDILILDCENEKGE